MKIDASIAFTILISALSSCSLFDKKVECDERMVIHSSNFNNLCDDALQIANCYLNKKDYKFAYYNFREYLIGCDTSYNILINLSDCAYKLEKDSMAESFAKLAILRDRSRSLAYHNLIIIYYNQSRNEDLLYAFRQHPSKNKDSLALYMAFETYWDSDSLEKAHHCIKQAMALKPKAKTIHTRYAAFLAHIGNYEKAINICQEMFEKEKKSTDVYFILADLLAFIYLDIGDTTKACEYGKYIIDSDDFKEDAERIKSYCEY